MLTYLHILDFAIIDALELDVRAGLTVLTGETGAGKSILVDALQLIAGGRAGAEVVRHGAQRAEVTATFELAQAPRELKSWLEDQSISVEQELSIRRVVTADGRSRAYLNGQSVTVQQLREAGNILLDIHGQHEFQTLTRGAGQREPFPARRRRHGGRRDLPRRRVLRQPQQQVGRGRQPGPRGRLQPQLTAQAPPGLPHKS